MTWYVHIKALQEPQDLGIVSNDRVSVVFNVEVQKTPSITLLEELVKLLVTAGVGVENTTIFASSSARLPTVSDAPSYLHLQSQGGTAPIIVQGGRRYQRPTVQVSASAKTFRPAYALAYAAYDVLVAVRNIDLN